MSDTYDELGAGREICEFFDGKPVSQDVLTEFCNSHGFEPVSEQRYGELKYAFDRDKRRVAIFPDIMELLSQLTPIRELRSKKEEQAANDANSVIEQRIAFLTEKHGLTYEELDPIFGDVSGSLTGALKHAMTGVSNMVAGQLHVLAEERFGTPLTIRAIGEHQRGGKPFDFKTGEGAAAEKWPDGCPVETSAGEGHTFLDGCEKQAQPGAAPGAAA